MAKLFSGPETISVLTVKDPALVKDDAHYPNGFEDAWEHYSETLEEGGLCFNPDESPIRFIFKSSLSFKEAKSLQSSQVKIKNGQPEFDMGYIFDEVRFALIDIENPTEDCKFIKAKDGYVKEDLLGQLHAAGILMEIWGRYQAHKSKSSDMLKKKSEH